MPGWGGDKSKNLSFALAMTCNAVWARYSHDNSTAVMSKDLAAFCLNLTRTSNGETVS